MLPLSSMRIWFILAGDAMFIGKRGTGGGDSLKSQWVKANVNVLNA